MGLKTKLTQKLGIKHPILLAPMCVMAGGRQAAAVTNAGWLGIIGAGHSGHRGLVTLVPEAADYLAQHAPNTVLVAAGGVGDGRGLAAALMLGADGVLVGTRFIAAVESEAQEGFRQAIIRADGGSTVKSNSVDVVRKRYWPNPEFMVRVLKNDFVAAWHGRERELNCRRDGCPGLQAVGQERMNSPMACARSTLTWRFFSFHPHG